MKHLLAVSAGFAAAIAWVWTCRGAEPATEVHWKVEVPAEDPLWGRHFRPAIAFASRRDFVAFAPPGKPDVWLLDAATGKRIRTLPGHRPPKGAIAGDPAGAMVKLSFSCDGVWLAGFQTFSSIDYATNQFQKLGCVNLWKTDGSSHEMIPLNRDQPQPLYDVVQDVEFGPSGTQLAIASWGKTLVGDALAPDELKSLPLGALVRAAVRQEAYVPVRLAFSADGVHLAIGLNRAPRDFVEQRFAPRPARVTLWDLSQDVPAPRLGSSPLIGKRLFYRIDALAVSPDGKRILVAGPGAWIWEPDQSESTRVLDVPAPYEATLAAGFDAQGRVALLGLGTEPFRFRSGDPTAFPDPMPEPLTNPLWETRLLVFDAATGKAQSAPRTGARAAGWDCARAHLARVTRGGEVWIEEVFAPSTVEN
jgi:hypothetical protein